MESLPDKIHGRRRGSVHADEDGVGASLLPRARAPLHEAWAAHRLARRGTTYVLLHGAAYGRYLALSADPAPQLDAVVRRVRRAGDGDGDLLLRLVSPCIHTNGSCCLWHTGVTVGDYGNETALMHWMVDSLPPRPAPPVLPGNTPRYSVGLPHSEESMDVFVLITLQSTAGLGCLFLWHHGEPMSDPRWIWYMRVDDCGKFNKFDWGMFEMSRGSVFNLRTEVSGCYVPRNEGPIALTAWTPVGLVIPRREALLHEPGPGGGHWRLWPKGWRLFRFDSSKLEQPIGTVIRENSWNDYLSQALEQTVGDTCTIVACTVCVEGVHRWE